MTEQPGTLDVEGKTPPDVGSLAGVELALWLGDRHLAGQPLDVDTDLAAAGYLLVGAVHGPDFFTGLNARRGVGGPLTVRWRWLSGGRPGAEVCRPWRYVRAVLTAEHPDGRRYVGVLPDVELLPYAALTATPRPDGVIAEHYTRRRTIEPGASS